MTLLRILLSQRRLFQPQGLKNRPLRVAASIILTTSALLLCLHVLSQSTQHSAESTFALPSAEKGREAVCTSDCIDVVKYDSFPRLLSFEDMAEIENQFWRLPVDKQVYK
ncbi:unnamed protein product, partial [Dibothriocephalus latus]